MAGIILTGFAGIAPRVSAHLLQDNEAQTAQNAKLYSGELRSWNKPGFVLPKKQYAFTPKTIFRSRNEAGEIMWLAWNKDVDVAKGPVHDNEDYPLYYTGDGTPKKTNAKLAYNSSSGATLPYDYLELGVPAPVSALSAQVGGSQELATLRMSGQSYVVANERFELQLNGSTVVSRDIARSAMADYLAEEVPPATDYRVYVYTYVSVFGEIEEESAPSPASGVVTVRFGQHVTLSGFSPVPEGKHNIQYIRVYRSVAGSEATPYLLVGQIGVNDTELVDNLSGERLGGVLPSASWAPPPPGLQGLTAMSNGILVGFVDNKLYFSEPFMPHAWPVEYMQTTAYRIVGIAAFGESLAVMTEGNPYIATGAHPDSISMRLLPTYEPCVSKRSIAYDEAGVMYVSPNGIILVNEGGAQSVSRNLLTYSEWQQFNPASMLGAIVDGKYFLFFEKVPGASGLLKGSLILDRYVQHSPLTVSSVYATSAYVEPTEAVLYLAVDDTLKQWDTDTHNTLPYEWKSKLFILPTPVNFGAAQIDADFGDIEAGRLLQERGDLIREANRQRTAEGGLIGGALLTSPLNTYCVNGSDLADVPAVVDDRFVLLLIIAGGKERARIQVKSRNVVRLPSGFRADRWEFKVAGNIPVKHIKIAETAQGLKTL